MEQQDKYGLVLEGGAMRGLFTAGVLDVLMENDVRAQAVVGVSAGACFGCNYKSWQPGRAIRYNLRFCGDRRYAGLHSLLTTGDVYNALFCYGDIPLRLDPFDEAAYERSPMTFAVVCTDLATGRAVYKQIDRFDGAGLTWIRASASMPLVSRIVRVEGRELLDGGIADPIPLAWMEGQGYARNIVVRTQPRGFFKQPNRMLPAIRAAYRQYPRFVASVADRHERYNAELRYIRDQERAGAVFLLCPDEPLNIGSVEKDRAEMRRVYNHGRFVAQRELPRLRAWLAGQAG